MFSAMPLAQKLSLLLEDPTTSFVLTMPTLLVAVAIGSSISDRVRRKAVLCAIGLTAIALMIAIITGEGGRVEYWGMAWSRSWRLLIAGSAVMLLGIPMGFFTPSGLAEAERHGMHHYLPLFWGTNLAFSAVAASMATLVALFAGYALTLWLSAGMYLMATLLAVSTFDQKPAD
jgi:hypothetical protein